MILQEAPITGGPRQYTGPVCLGCHAPASLAGYRCSRCAWPLCGPQCETRPLHRAECAVFAAAGVKPTQLRLELQTEVREDFTITEKAPSRAFFLLKLGRCRKGYDLCTGITISSQTFV